MKPDAAQVGDGDGEIDCIALNCAAEVKRSPVPNALAVQREIDFRRGQRRRSADNSAQIQAQQAFIKVVIHEVDFARDKPNNILGIEPERKTSRFSDVQKAASEVLHES